MLAKGLMKTNMRLASKLLGGFRGIPRLFSDAPKSDGPVISDEVLRKAFRKAEKEKLEEFMVAKPAIEPEIEDDFEAIKASIQTPKAVVKDKKQRKEAETRISWHSVDWVGDPAEAVLSTPFGQTKIPKFFHKKINGKASKIYLLEHDTKSNFVRKVFKEDRNALLLFYPRNDYHNCRNLLEGFSRRVGELFFAPEKLKTPAEIEKMSLEDRRAMYHANQRKLIELRAFLSRICVVVNRDFTVRLEKGPDIQLELRRYLTEFDLIDESDLGPEGNLTRDLLVPLTVILKVHSLKNLEAQGIDLDYLLSNDFPTPKKRGKEQFNPKIFREHFRINPEEAFKDPLEEPENTAPANPQDKPVVSKFKLYPLIGTFPPTNKVLLKFIFNRMREKQNFLKLKRTFLDIGVGTGVLPIVFRLAVQSTKQEFYGLDKSPLAVDCAKRNCHLQNVNLHTADFDLTKDQATSGKSLHPSFPEKFDFVICNPPWLVAKPLEDYDTGNYDHKEEVLKGVFRLVPKVLERSSGVFWLIYSDLSENLGLQEAQRVHQLAQENGLVVRGEIRCPADVIEKAVKSSTDVVKKMSDYIIYEICF